MGFHRRDFMLDLLRGNADAVNFLDVVYDIAHVWDDLIDGDAAVQPEAIHAAFFNAVVALPSNPFYRQHMGHLQPVLVNAITNWKIANALEESDDDYALKIAFILRSSYADLVTQSAVCIGGIDYGVEVGEKIRRWVHAETYTGYLANLEQQKAASAAAGE